MFLRVAVRDAAYDQLGLVVAPSLVRDRARARGRGRGRARAKG